MNNNIIVLPYRVNEYGTIKEICLENLKEVKFNQKVWCAISGISNEMDETNLNVAQRIIKEKLGYESSDNWTYLGKLDVKDDSNYCFAINVTELKTFKKINKDDFSFVPIGLAVKITDSYVLSLILKFFVNKYSQVFNVKD